MKHPSAGENCKNAHCVDEWEMVTLKAKDAESQFVVEELCAQDRHMGAEMLARGDFFAIEATDDDDHAFYILQAKGPIQEADDTLEDVFGNVMSEGSYFMEGHFLEWKDKNKEIYYVDTQKIAYIASHLVVVSRVEMNRVGDRSWKLTPAEEQRIDELLLS
jgi:hypothetical protein